MSTPLTDRITALTAQANAVTGAEDTTLADAVGTLIAGYGQGGGMELWKTVTLDEDHTAPSRGNTVYWRTFLDIPEQDILDGDIFLVLVSGNAGYLNKVSNFYMGHGMYFRDVLADGVPFVNAVFARTPVNTGAAYRSDFYTYANAGTVFTIYKIRL